MASAIGSTSPIGSHATTTPRLSICNRAALLEMVMRLPSGGITETRSPAEKRSENSIRYGVLLSGSRWAAAVFAALVRSAHVPILNGVGVLSSVSVH